jgi:DNA-binding winged helix-turn-helix (wHTH) protein
LGTFRATRTAGATSGRWDASALHGARAARWDAGFAGIKFALAEQAGTVVVEFGKAAWAVPSGFGFHFVGESGHFGFIDRAVRVGIDFAEQVIGGSSGISALGKFHGGGGWHHTLHATGEFFVGQAAVGIGVHVGEQLGSIERRAGFFADAGKQGLQFGLIDPFEPRELVARIHTVLRRCVQPQGGAADVLRNDVIYFDGWALHRDERTLVSPNGLAVVLSNAEFRLLSTFLQTPRHLFSRDQLVEQARGRSMDVFERSIDLLVSRLRQKLVASADAPSMIKTVRGAGYIFNVQSVQGRTAWHN